MDPNKETFETWNNIASMYQDKFMNLDLYDETYDHFCNSIVKTGAKILDVGCGPGNITKYLLSKRPDFDILGIDIAPNMIDLAKANNPKATFKPMDVRHIGQLDSLYDGIICGFCLPYLSSTETTQLISTSFKLLNENGLIYLSFVEGSPKDSGFKSGSGGRVFFNYHEPKEIITQLTINNFTGIEIFNIKYKVAESKFDIHTILMAQKNAVSDITRAQFA